MKDKLEFHDTLQRISNRLYKEYNQLVGDFDFSRFFLKVSDPAPEGTPTLFVLRVAQQISGFPPFTYNSPVRRTALEDYLTRCMGVAIVNLASVAGLVGSQLDPLYSMTKGGVTLFTKSSALAFGRRGWKIRVNSIHPGVIETDMGAQTFTARANQLGTNDPDGAKSIALKQHPIGRLGVPEDIALGIVFLASDDAGFMTGSGMVVDGGLTAQ